MLQSNDLGISHLADWLIANLGETPVSIKRITGGQSNETSLLVTDRGERILRRPPADALDASAHSMSREYAALSALANTDVPVPRPLALCIDPGVTGAPFLVMERIPGIAPLEALPSAYADDVRGAGEAIVRTLARIHSVAWREVGLAGFGKPDGFLARQVPRWTAQYESHRVRELSRFGEVARWLEDHRPGDADPGILHGDFRADNCMLAPDAPRVNAVIDWEMATIGDPLLDLGLLLAFWGPDRPTPRAMPRVQSFSMVAGAPSRAELARAYEAESGRSVEHLPYYLALALWKLAAIVEGAYAHHVAGRVNNGYVRDLQTDVPLLLEEAAAHAGIA